jgi:hypothetical protein
VQLLLHHREEFLPSLGSFKDNGFQTPGDFDYLETPAELPVEQGFLAITNAVKL